MFPKRIVWDEHILIVFSVLAGLAFSKDFDALNSIGFTAPGVILSLIFFYVILDNWYYLHKDLAVIDIDKPSEVVLYLLSIIAYSCLPFLYLFADKNSHSQLELQPSEWLLINLMLICLIDAIRKTKTIVDKHSKGNGNLDNSERKLLGSYVFYSLSGYFYSFIILIFIWASISSSWSLTVKSILVAGIWIFIRGTDLILIPRVSSVMANIFLNEEKEPSKDTKI